MGYTFSLILDRMISDDESATLAGGCPAAAFTTGPHPTKADVTVTQLDFDDSGALTLADAINAGLDAVKEIPDLSTASLLVPAKPNGVSTENATADVS